MTSTITQTTTKAILPKYSSVSNIQSFLERFFFGPVHVVEELVSFANANYVITVPTKEEKWVLRVSSPTSLKLSNFTQEIATLMWANKEGISSIVPKSWDATRGFLVTHWLNGQGCTADDFKKDSMLKDALALLRKLHRSHAAPIHSIFDPIARFRATQKTASEEGSSLSNEVMSLAKELEELFANIPQSALNLKPTHNDPSPQNFYNLYGILYLHDWESCALNDPMWDLTHLCSLGSIDFDLALKLYESEDKLAREKINFFTPFILFNSVVWADWELQRPSSRIESSKVQSIHTTFIHKIKEMLKSTSFKTSQKKLMQGVNMSSVNPRVLASTMDEFPNFKLKTEISTIFLEVDQRILMLLRSKKEDQAGTWGIPGGKKEKTETPSETLSRELKEETAIQLNDSDIKYHGFRYARIPGWDYVVHIYQAVLNNRPAVTLAHEEHTKYEWVSIYAFKLLKLIKGQDEVFDIVYKDRLWQRIERPLSTTSKAGEVGTFVLQKGELTLVFNSERRFVLNLIGTSGSGKGTQGDMLSKLFGIPNVSAGDIFRDEFRANSLLGGMVEAFDKTHYPKYLPDEVPIGMMTKRLSDKDCATGFILDGFPRTEPQGNATREVLLRPKDFHVPLFMDVPESDIWERLPGRNICPDCGHQVRKFDENPNPGFCPKDAAKGKKVKLEQRVEDVDRTKIERRLKMFSDNRNGILKSMEVRDHVHSYQLTNKTPPREVLHFLCDAIQKRLDDLHKLETAKVKSSGSNFFPTAIICTIIAGLLFKSVSSNK